VKTQCHGPGQNPDGSINEALRCVNQVNHTRPSRTGRHYCARIECRNARAREDQRERRGQRLRTDETYLRMFVHDLANLSMQRCPRCRLANALPGWPHRDPTGAACMEMVAPGDRRRVHTDYIDAAWPSPRTYVEGPSL
jgi:hypothetical protein